MIAYATKGAERGAAMLKAFAKVVQAESSEAVAANETAVEKEKARCQTMP